MHDLNVITARNDQMVADYLKLRARKEYAAGRGGVKARAEQYARENPGVVDGFTVYHSIDIKPDHPLSSARIWFAASSSPLAERVGIPLRCVFPELML